MIPQCEAVVPDDVFKADSGDGTADNPYSGTVTMRDWYGMCYMLELPEEIYVTIGTQFYEVWLTDDYELMPAYVEGDAVGISVMREYSNRSMHLYGTTDALGTCDVYYSDLRGEVYFMFSVHVVEPSIETLDFESDPVTDGILIPPGHHLVTFKYENYTNPEDIVGFVIAHQVVKHGDCAAFVEWRPESDVSDSTTIWCTIPIYHADTVDIEEVWDFEQPITSDTTLYWNLESSLGGPARGGVQE